MPRRPIACRSVLMVGTDLNGPGGIRAVVQSYIDGGLFDRVPCTYVATHRYGPAWRKAWAAITGWTRVAVLLYRLDAPLLHVHTASRASFWRKSVVCLLARLAGRPYLLHVHGGEFVLFYERECPAAARRIVRGVLAKAALVIALSESWRERLGRISPGATLAVVGNAVPLPRTGRRQRPDGCPAVLFLGDVSRAKGAHDLTRAFARIAPRFPGLRLLYGGTGDLQGIRRLAAELGVRDRVECAGWLDAPRKSAALEAATIFALPSYAEGVPMALLEAMSWRLPVIASPVGGIPQLIDPEVNGLLVVPGEIDALAAAMARLMSEAALRERLGAAARTTIERRFSLETTIERLVGIYGRFGIAARPAPPAAAVHRPAMASEP